MTGRINYLAYICNWLLKITKNPFSVIYTPGETPDWKGREDGDISDKLRSTQGEGLS